MVGVRPALIVGCPRSGTSWVSSVLYHAGWFCGDYATDPDNEHGYFENKELKKKFVRPFLPCADGLSRLPAAPINAEVSSSGVLAVLKRQGWRGEPWFFKDPKLTQILPSWLKEFPEATVIKVRRNRDDILRSFEETRFMQKRRGSWEEIADGYINLLEQLPGQEVWPFEYGPHAELRRIGVL